MEAVTISSKYQVVIPREVRKQFNLRSGQKIMIVPPIKKARNAQGSQHREHTRRVGREAVISIKAKDNLAT